MQNPKQFRAMAVATVVTVLTTVNRRATVKFSAWKELIAELNLHLSVRLMFTYVNNAG